MRRSFSILIILIFLCQCWAGGIWSVRMAFGEQACSSETVQPAIPPCCAGPEVQPVAAPKTPEGCTCPNRAKACCCLKNQLELQALPTVTITQPRGDDQALTVPGFVISNFNDPVDSVIPVSRLLLRSRPLFKFKSSFLI